LTRDFLERNIFWCTGQLILNKIIKIVATSCQILRLKCTEFYVGWDPSQTPQGSLQRSPDPLAGFKGASSKCGAHDFDPTSKNCSCAPAWGISHFENIYSPV